MALETLAIEMQMSLLLFVALFGYLIASRINQSAVIGEIFVGILIGPSLLGLITYTSFVQALAQLGALILLFVVGLEFKPRSVFQAKYGAIALGGVIVPWIGGYFIATLFNYPFASAVFVGTALTATSIAITAKVLKEIGRLNTPTAEAIIGAAVIDDILGLLALSVSVQMIGGSFDAFALLLVVIKAFMFMAVGLFVGRRLLRKAIVLMDKSAMVKKFPEFVFVLAMACAFFYSFTAEYIGLSGIVGAFLAGVSFEGLKLANSKDFKEGAEYLHIIFAAVFFVSLGVLMDLRTLDWAIVVFMLSLTAVAVLTKLIGCMIPCLLFKMKRPDALIVSFGMSPRGEVAMIVALIGLTNGIIGQDLYTAIVFMAVITTILTPPILKALYNRPAAAREIGEKPNPSKKPPTGPKAGKNKRK